MPYTAFPGIPFGGYKHSGFGPGSASRRSSSIWRRRASSPPRARSRSARSSSEPLPLGRPGGGDGRRDRVLGSAARPIGARTDPPSGVRPHADGGRDRARQRLDRPDLHASPLGTGGRPLRRERWSLTAGLAEWVCSSPASRSSTTSSGSSSCSRWRAPPGSSVNSASGRAVMHWFTAEERGFALGLRQASLPLGGALAAVALPVIVVATSLKGVPLPRGSLLGGRCRGAGDPRPSRRRGDAVVEAVPWTLRDRRLWVLSGGSGFISWLRLRWPASWSSSSTTPAGSSGEAAAVLAVAQVFAIGLRIAAGRWSDQARSRAAAPAARRPRDLRGCRARDDPR